VNSGVENDEQKGVLGIILALSAGTKEKKKGQWIKEWFKKRQIGLFTDEDFLKIRSDMGEMVTAFIEKENTAIRNAVPGIHTLPASVRIVITGQAFEGIKYATAIAFEHCAEKCLRRMMPLYGH
jgi:hypothetical protein